MKPQIDEKEFERLKRNDQFANFMVWLMVVLNVILIILLSVKSQ